MQERISKMSRYEYWLREGCSPDEALEHVREEGDDSEFEAAYWQWVHWLLNEHPHEGPGESEEGAGETLV